MRDTVIYTVGACKNVSVEESDNWRKEAQGFFSDYQSVYVININDYYDYEHDFHATDREVMMFCLRQASQADVILCNFDSLATSKGSTAELTAAFVSGVPIIGFGTTIDEEVYPWDKEFCDRIFYGPNAQEEAMRYIEKYYISKYL